MKYVIRITVFLIISVALYFVFSYLTMPKTNLHKYGMYNISLYPILSEKENTIDAIVLGDSLVYSSFSPMDVYHKYGFAMFNCSEPAQILPDAFEYYNFAIESQHPKLIIIEANIFFRNANKRPWYNKYVKFFKNALPLVRYHNNWKNVFKLSNTNGFINIDKGYKKDKEIKPGKNKNYMETVKHGWRFPKGNIEYLNKMIKIAEENNIKLIFVGFPSQTSWNMEKHKAFEKAIKGKNIEFIDYNLKLNELKIDWQVDSKDRGRHLNHTGALKITYDLAYYIKSLNILEDHRGQKKYAEWDLAYRYYKDL